MQTKETTIVEIKSSLDEVNNLLVAHIQKQFGMKVDKIEVDKEGVVTFLGSKSKDSSELMANIAAGDSLAASILGKAKARGGNRVVRNNGIQDFIRAELKNNGEMDVNLLITKARDKGFNVPFRSTLESILTKSAFGKNDVVKVSADVYRLRKSALTTDD